MTTYEEAREKFQDGDLLFFHRIGFRHVLRKPSNLLGWISNTGIAWAQLVGADHRNFWRFIHVGILYSSTELDTVRWRVAEFTASVPQGLDTRYVSERIRCYPAAVLWVPLTPYARARMIRRFASLYLDRVIGKGYNTAGLPSAITRNFKLFPGWFTALIRRLLHIRPTAAAKFCSQFVVDFYIACHVLSGAEAIWEPAFEEIKTKTMDGVNWSPEEMLSRLDIWDWPEAKVLV